MESRYRKIKKIAVVTGSRAEYDLLKPVMKALLREKEFKVFIVVCGMHLSKEFGYTINEIKKDGLKIDAQISPIYKGDAPKDMAKYLGRVIMDVSQLFQTVKPDTVLLLGDRIETLGAALASAYMNIFIVHLHGGEVTNAILDGCARHSISKFAHLHFPATRKSAQRLKKMGEDPRRIHMVGAPGLESILNKEILDKKAIAKKYRLDLAQKILLVVQHPMTTQISHAKEQMEQTLQAIKELKLQTVLLYPNADAGGRKMIQVIRKFEKCPFIRTYKNLAHEDYLGIMKIADVMVGNSSSGIIEAASFKLPVVNIGDRQKGRERSLNVVTVPHQKKVIKRTIERIINDKKYRMKLKKCRNLYGDGKTSRKIVKVFKNLKIDNNLMEKNITY